jgi:predicted ATP-dependent serine protease
MAKSQKMFICKKCGRPFTKWIGGIILTPAEKRFLRNPVCDTCKAAANSADSTKSSERK